MLYARGITMRNCGRFTVVSSDFGSDYRTHTHVTSESLYASLTRGATWRPRLIDLKSDPDTFNLAYNVSKMPVWFLPGVFVAQGQGACRLPDSYFDTTVFNVVNEFYPSTSKGYFFKKGNLEEKDRPYHVPTYGTIQAIKPGYRLLTFAFSPKRDLLEHFVEGQTFLMSKKRTMFQITNLTSVAEGIKSQGICSTGWLEFSPDYGGHFRSFEILAVTRRYIILRGTTRERVDYILFSFSNFDLYLPDFYLQQTPIWGLRAAEGLA